MRADSLSGTDLRSALSLRSACFALSWQEDHFAWQDILLYYFPGTQIGQES